MRKIDILLVLLSKLVLALASAKDLSFDERQFRIRVNNALKSMETILENTREPALLGTADDHHTYEDKYALVEFVANSGLASHMNALKFIGIDNDILEKAINWVHNLNQTVSLEFNGNMYSEFVKEEMGTATTTSEQVKETKNYLGNTKTETIKVKQPKWDYHYNIHLDYTLTIKSGDEEIHLIELSDSIPFVKTQNHKINGSHFNYIREQLKRDLNLTWLLRMIAGNESQFSIDRYHESCRTPSRNDDVKKLLENNYDINQFTRAVRAFIVHVHRTHQTYDELAVTKYNSSPQIETDDIFIPIVPVLENSTVLSMDDLDLLLKQQVRTLDSTTATATEKYKDSKFTTYQSVVLLLISDHITALSEQLVASIGYVEKMLETQLIEAIGKRIDSNDFENFMKHHNKKFFNSDYAPVPFSRAVQIPGRYPDGVISIESSDMDDDSEPIETLVRKIPANSNSSMVIPIDAATKVELQGDQFLHGWIQHVWQNNPGKSHNLVARAHQFSSYLLVIGILGGGATFIPKEALILKNKDEVIIPLLSEILPSAKEFKNAIASLSPVQQEFAKAFRSMQLESSVFGICVIPLKPQMENLLNLPEGALTKEIQLMQDLMSLFVEYQIPSDLLSFDGLEDTTGSHRVEAVKGHVSAVLEVIEGEKKKQLTEAKERAKMAHAEDLAQQQSRSRTIHQERVYHDMPQQANLPPQQANLPPQQAHMASARTFSADSMESASADSMESASADSMESASMPPPEPMQANSRGESNSETIQENIPKENDNSEPLQASTSDDFTFIPKLLDARLDEQNESALKSTIIKTSENWQRLRKKNLLLPAQRSYMNDQKKIEKNAAMDLLKAISRSGSLPIMQSDLHVIISLSHCFHNNLLSTVIQDNINPIEQVEKSLLMIGSVIHGVEAPRLLSLGEVEKRESIKQEGTVGATPHTTVE